MEKQSNIFITCNSKPRSKPKYSVFDEQKAPKMGFKHPCMILTHSVFDIYSLNKSRIPPHSEDAFCCCLLSAVVTVGCEDLFL